MGTIYKCMYDMIKELEKEDIPIENLKLLFDDPPLLKKAIKDLANERIKLFIKKVMKKQFDVFIADTMDIWNDMVTGEIRKLDKTKVHGTAIGMFGYPFNITYFFKQKGPGSPEYIFLDDDANKVYSSYDTFQK